MESICVVFVYLNTLNEIVNVIQETEPCVIIGDTSTIKEDRLLRMIEEKRHIGNKIYHLDDILKYNVDIESEKVQSFVNDEIDIKLVSLSTMIKDVAIEPSIFIFHEINRLYFLYRETLPKSILRKNGGASTTKKVRITVEDSDKQQFKKFMRKSMRARSPKSAGNVSRKVRETANSS